MLKRLIALAYYSIFWLVFFFFARTFFIIVQHHSAFQNNPGELLATFWHGSKLDISAIAYFLLIPVLTAIISLYFNGNWYQIFIRWYTWFAIVLSSLIIVGDVNLYSYWGFRMDYTPMLYLKTPGEAMASVSTGIVLLFLLTVILISSFFIWLYKKTVDSFFHGFKRPRYLLPKILIFMILLGSLLLPIRGGTGVAPINAGSVYFSDKMFLNHAAINVIWNVGSSAFAQHPVKNPYVFGDMGSARAIVDSLNVKRGIPMKVLNTDHPDIMIIVLESFSGYLIGPLSGDTTVTPNFNRYAKEGILFTNFYASGQRTDKALPAILDGYPAQPAQSIIKEPKKTQTLPSLIKILVEKGYKSSFWYGGEINFANFNAFVIGSGFHNIITQNNFNPKDYNSKWGVHDHVFFKMLQDSMESVKEPFLTVALTLSSHEPFDVPMAPVFQGDDKMTHYKNSVYYADKSLGTFLDWARQKPWWKNTLIVLVADHCARVYENMPVFGQNVFRIPMLWIGGAVSKNIKIDKLGGQVDIPSTLLSQLGVKCDFPYAKDLLSDNSRSFAFYTYNEGFAFITDSSAVAFDLKVRQAVLTEGKRPDIAEKYGKACLQVFFDDYVKR